MLERTTEGSGGDGRPGKGFIAIVVGCKSLKEVKLKGVQYCRQLEMHKLKKTPL